MRINRPVFLSLSLLGASALAQDAPNPYEGNWAGTCGIPFELEIHGQTGKWTPHANKGVTKNNPCAAYVKPIVVEKATADELVFMVKGSEAMQGCPDPKLHFHPVDATHMEATRRPGAITTSECNMSRP
jgi:hypothetical protein